MKIKKIEYMITTRSTINDLEGMVNLYLKMGFKPIGGPFTWTDLAGKIVLCQALKKTKWFAK